jgi:hypothetical protein
MTASFSSVTVPDIVPVVCPRATTEELSSTAKKRGRQLVFIVFSLVVVDVAILVFE